METTYKTIHPYFKFNGFHFANDELMEVAYSLIKEGEPFERGLGDFLLDWLNDKDTITVRTSGSTGAPKKITLKKQQMVNSALATGAFFDIGHNSTALLCLSADYIAGKMMLVRALVLGWKLDFVSPSSTPLEGIEKHYDFVAMVPLQAKHSLNKLHLVKTLIVGGAPISFSLRKALEKVSSKVYETFGMTETISHIAMKKIDKDTDNTHFTVLPNVSISKDERDCLIINAQEVSNAPIVTNDVVRLVTEDAFEWLGRYDTVINSGGIKLHPERIEHKLEPLISGRFFISALADSELGDKLVLFVENDKDAGVLQQIKSLSNLEPFEVPKEIHVIPKFVEGANGKIQRVKTMEKLTSKNQS